MKICDQLKRSAPGKPVRSGGWTRKALAGATTVAVLSVASGQAQARPGLTAAKQAWKDCLALCPVAGVAGPQGAAAWALGCTIGYDLALLSKLFAYAPRFDPDNNGYANNEAVIYATGNTMTLRAGRWNGSGFIAGRGSVASVDFQIVDWPTFLASKTFDSAPWSNIGQGTFEAATSFWTIPWSTTGFSSINGYVLRANFHDAALGAQPVPAPNVALVPAPAASGLLGAAGLVLLARRRRR